MAAPPVRSIRDADGDASSNQEGVREEKGRRRDARRPRSAQRATTPGAQTQIGARGGRRRQRGHRPHWAIQHPFARGRRHLAHRHDERLAAGRVGRGCVRERAIAATGIRRPGAAGLSDEPARHRAAQGQVARSPHGEREQRRDDNRAQQTHPPKSRHGRHIETPLRVSSSRTCRAPSLRRVPRARRKRCVDRPARGITCALEPPVVDIPARVRTRSGGRCRRFPEACEPRRSRTACGLRAPEATNCHVYQAGPPEAVPRQNSISS